MQEQILRCSSSSLSSVERMDSAMSEISSEEKSSSHQLAVIKPQTRTQPQTHVHLGSNSCEKTASASFVQPRVLVTAPNASKRSLRGRVLAADHAQQPETTSTTHKVRFLLRVVLRDLCTTTCETTTWRRIEESARVTNTGGPSSRVGNIFTEKLHFVGAKNTGDIVKIWDRQMCAWNQVQNPNASKVKSDLNINNLREAPGHPKLKATAAAMRGCAPFTVELATRHHGGSRRDQQVLVVVERWRDC